MKFLIINGKLQKGGNGKFVTVPDDYNNEPLKLNDKVLMIGGKVVGNNPKGESVLPKLATPQNVIIDGTTLTFDEVENATSYAVLADGSEIGTVEKTTGYNVSLIYTDDFVSGIFAYSLDGGSTYQDITTSDIRLTNVTQIRLKSHGLDAGTEIFQAEYGISTPSGTSISPPIGGSADKNPYELDNIILTADTGFFFYTYYD